MIGPNHQIEYTLYGIAAPAEIPVKTEPNTKVTVQIAGQVYGPVRSGEDGLAQMRVQIPPTATSAVISLENNIGERSESQLNFTTNSIVVPSWQFGVHGYYLHFLTYNPITHRPMRYGVVG